MYKKFSGFTLAEVLITLGIIGVVAALTIPTLISKYQKQEYVTGLQKAYTEFNQALRQLTNDYGCGTDLHCTGVYSTGDNDVTFGDAITKYFKVIKNCRMAKESGCFPDSIIVNIDGSGTRGPYYGTYGEAYTFITADGMAFSVYYDGYGCNSGEMPKGYNFYQICGGVTVDVNGPNKGPNNFGRDIFDFSITNGRGVVLYPRGGQELTYSGEIWRQDDGEVFSCDNTPPAWKLYGMTCAGRVMEEGWQMNY